MNLSNAALGLTERGVRVANRWAGFGDLSAAIAARLPVRPPPVLVLSMPRSGSTWVGLTLGAAPDALYLNEPVSEVVAKVANQSEFFEVDADHPADGYVTAARFVRAAVPAFGERVVKFPRAFGLRGRHGKTLVIKEVNPLAIEWYVQAFAPRLVYLVRHPAAVACSLDDRGWNNAVFEQRFLPERRASLPAQGVPASFWGRIGAVQAVALRMADDVRAAMPADAFRLVRYEDVCASPDDEFAALFAFAGLTFDEAARRALQASTGGSSTESVDDAWGTTRNTAAMADAWRTRITADQLADVRAGWDAVGADLYNAAADWTR